MKTLITTFAAIAAAMFLSTSANAAEKTLKGEGLCAKCELKETTKCQNAIRVEEGGKKVVYYIDESDATKGLHKKLCSATEKLTVKGTVSEKDGKKWVKASKVEEAK
ncbi:MAG TPA: hypothetical protein DCM86_13150 [Verrucomicrobiales bacterium]|nr:hypothetical protein [Verrucomicrobiales bacterium]